jgi:hypothetical protein
MKEEAIKALAHLCSLSMDNDNIKLLSAISGFEIGIFDNKAKYKFKKELCFLYLFIIYSYCHPLKVDNEILGSLFNILYKNNFKKDNSNVWLKELRTRIDRYSESFDINKSGGSFGIAGIFLDYLKPMDSSEINSTAQTKLSVSIKAINEEFAIFINNLPLPINVDKLLQENVGPTLPINDPVILKKPDNFNNFKEDIVGTMRKSSKFDALTKDLIENINKPSHVGFFSTIIKDVYLRSNYGKEGTDFTQGDKEYIKGTSLQKQEIIFNNGDKKTIYFDFSEFGEKF